MIGFDLLGPRPPRAKPLTLMHAIDSGVFPDGKDAAHFTGCKCGRDTGWICASRSEARRGIPCPVCNGETP